MIKHLERLSTELSNLQKTEETIESQLDLKDLLNQVILMESACRELRRKIELKLTNLNPTANPWQPKLSDR